jgi:hypothetical protein
MKAKELAEKYRSDGMDNKALANLIADLCRDVVDLCEKRGGSRSAVNTGIFYGAWNEINAKWKSIAYNNPEFGLKLEGFRDWCKSKDMLP